MASLAPAQYGALVSVLERLDTHDFNKMLAIIIGGLDLVLRRLKSTDERITRYLDNAMDGAKRAAALTARLLAFSRQ